MLNGQDSLEFKLGSFRPSKELDESPLPAYSYKLEMSVFSKRCQRLSPAFLQASSPECSPDIAASVKYSERDTTILK